MGAYDRISAVAARFSCARTPARFVFVPLSVILDFFGDFCDIRRCFTPS